MVAHDSTLSHREKKSNKYSDIMSIEVTNYSLFEDGDRGFDLQPNSNELGG